MKCQVMFFDLDILGRRLAFSKSPLKKNEMFTVKLINFLFVMIRKLII